MSDEPWEVTAIKTGCSLMAFGIMLPIVLFGAFFIVVAILAVFGYGQK